MQQTSFDYHYVSLKPSQQIGLHRQPTFELSIVLSGTGTRLIGETTSEFHVGEVIFIAPEIPHCWYFDKTLRQIENISLSIPVGLLQSMATLFPEATEMMESILDIKDALVLSPEKSQKMKVILLQMKHENPIERLSSLLLLLEMIASGDNVSIISKGHNDAEKERIVQVQAYVACNFGSKITLPEIASHVGMSVSNFCSFYKRMTAQTFTQYLNEYRVKMAMDLLKGGKMKVSQVCYHCGFNDLPYFDRKFKQLTGVSPNEYRA